MPFYNKRSQRKKAILLKRVECLPFVSHPGFKWDAALEGYQEWTFGGRAGPSIDFFNLCHELAHAAEFGYEQFEHRAKESGWSFRLPYVWVVDRHCVEPMTSQCTMREIRTLGRQLHIMRMAGCKIRADAFAEYGANLCDWLPDWYTIAGKTKEDRQAWCKAAIIEEFNSITQEQVLQDVVKWLGRTHKHFLSNFVGH